MGLPPNYRVIILAYMLRIVPRSICRVERIGNVMRCAEDVGKGYVAPTYHGNQDLVASGTAHGETLAVLVEGTGANSEDLGLVELLNTALREEDTGGGLGLGLDALDQDAVQEGGKSLDVTDGRLLALELV